MIIVSVMLSQYNSLSIFNSIVSILGVICVHIFGNLYNDYFDGSQGQMKTTTNILMLEINH